MITVDCKDVLSIQNDLLVYVADQLEAIPTLKKHQFTLSTLDDDQLLNTSDAVSAIKEYLDSIHEANNFAVIAIDDVIRISSFSGKTIKQSGSNSSNGPDPQNEMFSCPHCGFITRYQVEFEVHTRIHYI